MCVFSTASALFMFPALYLYYKPALDIYSFEKADGVGCAYDIVIQGFIRFASIALGPVFIAVSVIYVLVSTIIIIPPKLAIANHCTEIMTITADKLGLIQFFGLPSSSPCQRCPEPDLDSSSHSPHLCCPWSSISSLSGHISCGWIL